jgi:hypothetical protein
MANAAQTDPYQLNNLYPLQTESEVPPPELLGRSLNAVISRLDALMLVLKSCTGNTCIEPWDVLHRGSRVKSLKDALEVTFDTFYDNQPRVSFTWCDTGYIREAEGPQTPLTQRYGLPWDVWV